MSDDLPFDTSVAHPARVYDYWLGGVNNFPADREAAEKVIAVNPGIVEGVRSNRAFLARVVRHLVGEAGVRQVLDVGAGLPSVDNVHEVAGAIAPDVRVVYVDNDPIVNLHAQHLLADAAGRAAYLHADLRDPSAVLERAADTLDLDQPVALLFLMTLQFVPDEDGPREIVRTMLDALAPGSHLVVSHPTIDPSGVANAGTAQYNQRVATGMTRRTPEEVTAFFDGLDLLDPGVVTLHDWRPDDPAAPRTASPAVGGVGAKPVRLP